MDFRLPADGRHRVRVQPAVEARIDPELDPVVGASRERLARGALYPTLAAFRWMVEDDPAGDTVQWRGGFENVLTRWREIGPRLVVPTVDKSREVAGKPRRDRQERITLGALHKEVAFVDLMNRQAPAAPETEPA